MWITLEDFFLIIGVFVVLMLVIGAAFKNWDSS